MLHYITCGESHGQYLAAILEGLPSGLAVDTALISRELARRQGGHGRGGRMKIERDAVQIISGVLKGKTTGAPVGFLLTNRDFKIDSMPDLVRPRPGHADLVGSLKYRTSIRAVLERASARETAMRVAVGALSRQLPEAFGMEAVSHVLRIGRAGVDSAEDLSFEDIRRRAPGSPVYCADREQSQAMVREIDAARREGDTLGGLLEVRVRGVLPGLGSHVHWERKLQARLAMGIMSIQAFKGVEFGIGRAFATRRGSECHDEIAWERSRGYFRKSNRLGGFEGGMTTGEEIVVRVTMKPISTLMRPLYSVNMKSKKVERADVERSDVCTVPAASVIAENVVCFEIARAALEKFGGDSMQEIAERVAAYRKYLLKA